VDALGCPIVTDADGDGVPDSIDRCPDTRAGQRVDSIGCPILFVVERGEVQPLILRGVNFEIGRSALTRESYVILDEVAASLVAHPDVRVEIAGHTDITGSRALNSRLSLERAQAVEVYLAQKGVEPSRMVSRGYGPDEPIATNATAAGRAQNRRVELRRLEGGTQ
jgi:OOP family OmpA-OmpF porin